MRAPALLAAALTLVSAASSLAVPTLDRDPADYAILGLRAARLKSLTVEAPGCNVGVNCAVAPVPGGCGRLTGTRASVASPGQVAADAVCLSGSFFEVFRNQPGTCGLGCSQIASPGSAPDCTEPFTTPILGDLDGDGQASCDGNCVSDVGDVAAACGVTLPLPACDPSKPVLVERGKDCSVADAVPFNGRCDLPAGTYGAVNIQDRGELVLGAGTTVVCSLVARKSISLTSAGPATIIVPGDGGVHIHNNATVGTDCGVLKLVAQRGRVHFSRNGTFTLDVCALEGRLGLGGRNKLRGHFVGSVVAMDFKNTLTCCGPTPPTTTSTSSTSSTTTSPSTSTSTSSSTTLTTTSTSTSSTSVPPSSCGNGIIDVPQGEECDGTNIGSATCPGSPAGAFPGCTPSCKLDFTSCVATTTTTSTTVATSSSSSTSSSTTLTTTSTSTSSTSVPPSSCGNGIIDVPQGEECDGTNIGSATCPGSPAGAFPSCTPSCKLDFTSCVVTTTTTSTTVATSSSSSTSSSTTLTTTSTSTSSTSVPPSSCGNGIIDVPQGEECDGTNIGSATCPGSPAGAFPSCTPSCKLDFTSCVATTTTSTTVATSSSSSTSSSTTLTTTSTSTSSTSVPPSSCGNGIIDVPQGEECDGTNIGSATCPGSPAGAFPSCTPSCKLDFTSCPVTTTTTSTTPTTTASSTSSSSSSTSSVTSTSSTTASSTSAPSSSSSSVTSTSKTSTSNSSSSSSKTSSTRSTTSSSKTSTTKSSTSTSKTSTSKTNTSSSKTSTTNSTTSTTRPPKSCGEGSTAPCVVKIKGSYKTYWSVQAAVNAARSGATIRVSGVCRGPVYVVDRNDLTIEGVAPTPEGCPKYGLQPQDLESTIRGGSDDEEIIKVTRSTNVTVRFLNLVDGRSAGVEQKYSKDGTTFCNCVARNDEGIEIHGGKSQEVTSNLVVRNRGDGIRLHSGGETGRWHTVKWNRVDDNGGDGIVSEDTRDSTISDNTSKRNGGSGIHLDGADDHRVTDNRTGDNRVCGITLEHAEENFVDDNRDGGDSCEDSPVCCVSGDDNAGNNVPRACR